MSFLKNLFTSSSDPAHYRAPEGIPGPDAPRQLALYKFDSCPFCQRVMRHADKLGMTEHIIYHDVRKDPDAQRALIAMTGGTQVPCLVIDEVPLLESRDINLWLSAYAHHHDIT